MAATRAVDQAPRDREAALLRRRNVRDLGGLPARSGLVFGPRRVFRGSDPSRFEPEEHDALTSLNLRSIVDLRATAEMNQSNPATTMLDVQVFHLPLFEIARNNWLSPVDQSPQATAIRYFEMLHDGLDSLATAILHIAQPGRAPFLVCCAAGRDRTGIVVACLLDLLDVTDEAIAVDYALSDLFVRDGGRAHPGTIIEFLRLLRSHHGSTQRLLVSRGVSEPIVEALRREFLVGAA